MEKKKIYFAGKIKKEDDWEMWWGYYYDRRKSIVDFWEVHDYYVDRTELESFVYTWPKYYREHWRVYDWAFDHDWCFYECKNAILESDIVFVYLDDMDSYWTIAEVWLAHWMCKEIIIYYTQKVDEKEMWFVFQFADKIKKVQDHIDARYDAKIYIWWDLKTMPYKDYLQSDHWKKVSKLRKELDWWKCVLCSSKNKLNAHHRSYENRWTDAEINDLITLCNNCHSKFHDK